MVDPFGDGVFSSPSNYQPSDNKEVPEFNIRDMVKAQHWLITEKFGISQLFAVTGASMGGMQAFEWLVTVCEHEKIDHAVVQFLESL